MEASHSFEDRFADAYMGKTLQSDMTFFLESDSTLIPAHTLIVAASSVVLERLIHGTGTIVNTDRVVKVPDCPAAEFQILLYYIYTGKAGVIHNSSNLNISFILIKGTSKT